MSTITVRDDAFVDLVCSDPDLLQAEFDAIIAASWATPPAKTVVRVLAPAPHGNGRKAPSFRPRPHLQPGRPSVGEWRRQRSPPAAASARTKPPSVGSTYS